MTLELRDVGEPGESLGEVVLSFAEALGADIADLPSDPTTRIHDIRVGTKKLRALLRLAGDVVGPEERAAIATELREIRQVFSGSRDEEVMRHRLGEILCDEAPAALAALGLDAESSSPLPAIALSRELAAELRARFLAVDFSSVTSEVLSHQAAHSYRRARKEMVRCRSAERDDVLMHEWRKRTKDVCYHALCLSSLEPMRKLAQPLDALAELLGEYHDLALLTERSSGHQAIRAAVDKRKRKVARECFRAAKKIFHRKPSTLQKKLAARFAE